MGVYVTDWTVKKYNFAFPAVSFGSFGYAPFDYAQDSK